MFTVQKFARVPGTVLKERLHIKSFNTSDAMCRFLGSQYDNTWSESKLGLKAGVYAKAGGQWHNVKNLDPSVLAHI